jgi:hypothetical protein
VARHAATIPPEAVAQIKQRQLELLDYGARVLVEIPGRKRYMYTWYGEPRGPDGRPAEDPRQTFAALDGLLGILKLPR